MKLTRLTAQRHDYNLKLTKDELIALSHRECDNDGCDHWSGMLEKIIQLAVKEAERLGGGE